MVIDTGVNAKRFDPTGSPLPMIGVAAIMVAPILANRNVMTNAPIADAGSNRLDNFVDGTFAFSVTLLVIAEGGGNFGYRDLLDALWRLPGFAGGFVLIAMFWYAHVGWRRAGGRNDAVTTLISLALVFMVLIYVHPMRVMLTTLVDFLQGRRSPMSLREVASLFTLYGGGFAVMSGLITGLYVRSIAKGHLPRERVNGIIVWGMVTASGLLSVVLALIPATVLVAPLAYWLLPIAIPLALRLYQRRMRQG